MSDVQPQGDLRQLVTVGGLRLVMGFDESREYLDAVQAITRVPRAPAWLLGVLGSSGLAVPVVDLVAWAQRTRPEPWRVTGNERGQSTTAVTAHVLRALRLRDGADAWAFRVTQAPSVVNLNTAQQSQAITAHLPLSVSASYGQLMPHAVRLWTLADGSWALQIRWPTVVEALRQDLSARTVTSD
jgi:chemotaxis signal transduction protein